MNIITIFLIALGLAMDAFAVAVASGVSAKCLLVRDSLKMAIYFGAFQAIMPIVGWATGLSFQQYIDAYDHWLAFVLLAFLGAKMIYESFKLEEDCSENLCNFDSSRLFVLAIATSIDALGVGLSFSLLNVTVFMPAIVIGLVTFVLCVVGVWLGNKVGHLFEGKIEIFGGLILVFIAFKILLQGLGIF